MSKKRTDIRILTFKQLAEMAATDPRLLADVDKHNRIEAAGGVPVIRYSKFNGVSVVDKREFPIPQK